MGRAGIDSKLLLFAIAGLVSLSYFTVDDYSSFVFAQEDFELEYEAFSNPSLILSGDKLMFLTTSDKNAPASISVIDTKTGSLLYKIMNPVPNVDDDWFGKHLAVFGNNVVASSLFTDPDTDKRTNLIHVFDGDDGELLYSIENPVSDSMYFGYSLKPVGDNLAVYATDKDPNDSINDNMVYVFDASGTLLYSIDNPDVNGDFGRSLASIDDVLLVNVRDRGHTRDNIPEIIYAFDGYTGKPLYTIEYPKQTEPHPDKSFGRSTEISGDNLVIRSNDVVFIYDGNTGELRHTVDHPVTTNNELQTIFDSLDDDGTDDYVPYIVISGVVIAGVLMYMILSRRKK